MRGVSPGFSFVQVHIILPHEIPVPRPLFQSFPSQHRQAWHFRLIVVVPLCDGHVQVTHALCLECVGVLPGRLIRARPLSPGQLCFCIEANVVVLAVNMVDRLS